jgi:hypothetical protein
VATKEGSATKVEVHEMSVDEDQVRDDWIKAVGLSEHVDEYPDALTIAQLLPILGFADHKTTQRWAERGVAAGTAECHIVYRDTGSGFRKQRVYRIIK